MKTFEFNGVSRIFFGRGEVSRLGELAPKYGAHTLCVFNGPTSLVETATGLLARAGVLLTAVKQSGEPTVSDIDHALSTAREAGCDWVIGIGGGSAIDAAKAVAGLLTNGGVALDYMEVIGKGQTITKPAAPWIAIPTTAGTGAEVTRNAVVGDPVQKFKASIRSELLLPRVAILDPELAVDVPADVTARSGMDALCQCIEAYTSTGANPMTDPLAHDGIGRAAAWLLPAVRDGKNLEARQNMAIAALYSGIALTNAGLGAVHGFAAPIGANFPAPHGAVCAALLPHVIEANIAALRASEVDQSSTLARYASAGQAVWGPGQQLSQPEAIDALVRYTADLPQTLHIPPLSAFGLNDACIPEMVLLAKRASSMKFNPVILPDAVLADVLGRAIRG